MNSLSALFLAVGLVVAVSIVAFTWRSKVLAEQTFTVTGSANTSYRID